MAKFRVFEAFAGVGSQRMALRNLGVDFEVVGISEIDKHALLAYTAIHHSFNYNSVVPLEAQMYKELQDVSVGINFSTQEDELPKKGEDLKKLYIAHKVSKNWGDIRKLDPNKLPDMDLFTYSFPCKDCSQAGEQGSLEEGSGTASSLIWDCKKIIEAKKPAVLMMENVKNLTGKNHKAYMDNWNFWLDGQGYYNYWEVLNASDFGVPQNRERVIMISIRKELDKGYEFPPSRPLTVALRDLLEDEVDEKFFVPESSYKLREPLPHQDVSYCIDANYWKGASVDQFIEKRRRQLVQIGEMTVGGNEANNRIYSEEGLSPTLNSMQGGNRQPKIVTHKVVQSVSVRKYDVDTENLKKLLSSAKTQSGLTINMIAEKLDKPKTLVEHWFRGDNCFAIPDVEVWQDLKDLLNITTDEFDKSVLEFIVKDNEFDTANRVYGVEGLAPTLTTASKEKILLDNVSGCAIRGRKWEDGKTYQTLEVQKGETANAITTVTKDSLLYESCRVRRLTPNECWRLMGFSDNDFIKARDIGGLANTKLYERAGRGIVVPMLEDVFRALFECIKL